MRSIHSPEAGAEGAAGEVRNKVPEEPRMATECHWVPCPTGCKANGRGGRPEKHSRTGVPPGSILDMDRVSTPGRVPGSSVSTGRPFTSTSQTVWTVSCHTSSRSTQAKGADCVVRAPHRCRREWRWSPLCIGGGQACVVLVEVRRVAAAEAGVALPRTAEHLSRGKAADRRRDRWADARTIPARRSCQRCRMVPEMRSPSI